MILFFLYKINIYIFFLYIRVIYLFIYFDDINMMDNDTKDYISI